MTHPPQPDIPAELAAIAALLAHDRSGANGDDAAVVDVPGARTCISIDSAIDGVHLHRDLSPHERGYRAAACALSDLAAMAARPIGAVAAITVPAGAWADVEAVSAGIEQRCSEAGCHLVGGDLASAPAPGDGWTITIACLGSAGTSSREGFLSRVGARPGDVVVVTGHLGRSAAALADHDAGLEDAAPWSWYTSPPARHAAALAIAPWATSLIDLSDGLLSDARHLMERSGVGMHIDLDLVPIEPLVMAALGRDETGDPVMKAATAGDDYELLLTARPEDLPAMRDALATADPRLSLTILGDVADSTTIDVHRRGQQVPHVPFGYAHR